MLLHHSGWLQNVYPCGCQWKWRWKGHSYFSVCLSHACMGRMMITFHGLSLGFKLINPQLEDKNHYSVFTTTFRELKTAIASQRVMGRDMVLTGYGRQCFITHADLDYNEAKNCQYLKDDCLYFRISVEAESSSKPWLIMYNWHTSLYTCSVLSY